MKNWHQLPSASLAFKWEALQSLHRPAPPPGWAAGKCTYASAVIVKQTFLAKRREDNWTCTCP